MATPFWVQRGVLQRLFQVAACPSWHLPRTITTTSFCLPSSLPLLPLWHPYQNCLSPLHTTRTPWNRGESANQVTTGESEGVEERDQNERKGTILPFGPQKSLVFNRISFENLPVVHIKASYNNTIITVTNHSCDEIFVKCSCGTEGFKNAKKSTSIAGQTVGIAAATKALAIDVKMVRVLVRGLGPGRQSSIKGLQMGGIEIVSITDNTPVPHNGYRPRKARRL